MGEDSAIEAVVEGPSILGDRRENDLLVRAFVSVGEGGAQICKSILFTPGSDSAFKLCQRTKS